MLDLVPAHIRADLALMANTALEPSDALTLRRDKIENGVIWAQRGKTGHGVPLLSNGRLQVALDAAPSHDAITVLAAIKGTPCTYAGFRPSGTAGGQSRLMLG